MAERQETNRPADCRCTRGARCMPCLVDKGVIPPPKEEKCKAQPTK